MIVIVGAGLAGLSTAYHLPSLPYRVFEKEKEVGGLCRSYRMDGFTFDFTGHLLHFRQPAIRALVDRLLHGRLAQHSRRSYIYSHETYTEYPFQVNTHGLPPAVIRECLLGFIATLVDRPARNADAEPRSFHAWILENLGEGMAKHFMVPFNEKLWQVKLDELTSDWVSWLVPKPTLEDVINGALGIKDKAFGYNPTFLYPADGGIEVLPRSLEASLQGELVHGAELAEVDTRRRRALFHNGREEHYEALVSTIPIPELVRRCRDLPTSVYEAAQRLRCVSVYNVNLGIGRETISDKHWIYFPERAYPFYRAGFPMNFAPALGPEGASSIYVEISHQPTHVVSPSTLLDQVRRGLEHANILRPDDDVLAADVRDIRYAYVLFDAQRAAALPVIFEELERRGIYSIGRYGRWEHTSMEDAIAQGQQLAGRLGRLLT